MSFLVILFQLNSATNQRLKNKKLTSNSQYFHFFFGLVYGVNILEIDENQVKGKVVREQAQNQVKYYANASEATSLDKNCVICNK